MSTTTTTTTSESATSGSMFLQDALQETSSFATTFTDRSSQSNGSSAEIQYGPARAVIGKAERANGDPFSRANPFQGSVASIEKTILSPVSPHSSANKHPIAQAPNMPRRPSHLRNVKTGSIDSEASSENQDSVLQPISPAWASTGPVQPTLFNDPFGSPKRPRPPMEDGPSPSRTPGRQGTITPGGGDSLSGKSREGSSAAALEPAALEPAAPEPAAPEPAALEPAALEPAAAWAAPESWGVEGDEIPPEEGTSSEEDENWAPDDEDSPEEKQPDSKVNRRKPMPLKGRSPKTSVSTRPGSRQKPGSARPSTASRSLGNARPGTSGSAHGPMTAVRQYQNLCLMAC